MIKNLKTKSKLLVLTVMNLFKARIRSTNLYATTEEENGRFACGNYEFNDASSIYYVVKDWSNYLPRVWRGCVVESVIG